MSLVNGKQEPRIVLLDENDVVVDDFTLEKFSSMRQGYTPEYIRHVLDDGTIETEFLGHYYKCSIYYQQLEATELLKLRKLLDSRAYRTARLYPHATEKANYFQIVTLDDEEIELLYFKLLRMEELTIRFVSSRRIDFIPLELPDFVSWGNISLTFASLTMQFSTLT